MVKKHCRLCFEKITKPIGIFTANGIKLNIAKIICVHFPGEVIKNDHLPQYICLHCWIRLKYFHDFYDAVNSAKSIFLKNMAKEVEPNFMRVNLDAIEYIEDVQFVKVESIGIGDTVLIENQPSQDHTQFGNDAEIMIENAQCNDDVNNDKNEESICEIFDIKCDPHVTNVTTRPPDLATVIFEKADQTSSTSINMRKMANKELMKLMPEYFDLNCEICKYKCISLTEMSKHYREKHKQSKATVKCCQRKLNFNLIRDHILFHLNPDVFKCNECGKTFTYGYLLRAHKATHKKLKTFECDICKKVFSGRRNIFRHMITRHGRDKGRFECDICKRRFNHKNYVKNHIKITHQNIRHVCRICGNEYSTAHAMQNHLMVHEGIPKQRIKCELCSNTFRDKYRLAAHMKTHQHGKTTIKRKFQCPYCLKVKSNQYRLRRHVFIVHNFREYKCHICERELQSSSLLRDHIELHAKRPEILYKCDYCPEQYKGGFNVQKHMKKFHSIEWNAAQNNSNSSIQQLI